ncbi:MAG: hypothetical protein ACO3O0_06290 [Bacteroidia bacterium]
MKKNLCLLTIAFLILPQTISFGQAFESGRSYIGAGYGIGFGWKAYWKAYDSNSEFKSKNFGPWVLKYDYGLNDKFSAGIYIANQNSTATWKTNNLALGTYKYEIKIGQLLAVGRGSYHFNVSNDRIDAYTGLSMGYRKYTYKVDSDDDNFKFDYSFGGAFGFGWHGGIRYELNDLIGLYGEVGAGQVAAIQLGGVLKL